MFSVRARLQERVRSARKQFRSWRRQGSPAPHPAVTDGVVCHHEPPEGRAHHPHSPTPVASVPWAPRPVGLNSAEHRRASFRGRPSSPVGAVCTWKAGAGSTEKRVRSSNSGSSGSRSSLRNSRDEGFRGKGSTQGKPAAMGHVKTAIDSGVAIERSDTPGSGKAVREQSRDERRITFLLCCI